MQPVPEWRRILVHAWSVRILLFGGLCSAAASAVSLIDGQTIGHPALVPAVAFILNVAALIARVTQQKHLGDSDDVH